MAESNEQDAAQHRAEAPVEIRVEDLRRSFDKHRVLQGVDLTIRRGEIVAIVGPSGCGKTVFVDHIIGLLTPDSGRILVANHDAPGAPLVDLTTLDEDGLDAVRKHWAVVFQRNALFSGTVYDNVALWLREIAGLSEQAIEPIVRESVGSVGLDYDEVARKDRDDLSGGMAKRVAIARAVAMNPNVIFYDEPTTGLDPQSSVTIHDLIGATHHRPLRNGSARTSIVITHDKDLLARIEPRIVMLNEGRVYFDGPYREFQRSDSELIKPYLALMPVLHQRRVLED
ncbi:MAG: ATP-binding cassette domain-containing protein [Phycisphaeraceae bacterium]|nr:ATP-binding cassette domain-containing protein [Phycisphaeraceae bacterium]